MCSFNFWIFKTLFLFLILAHCHIVFTKDKLIINFLLTQSQELNVWIRFLQYFIIYHLPYYKTGLQQVKTFLNNLFSWTTKIKKLVSRLLILFLLLEPRIFHWVRWLDHLLGFGCMIDIIKQKCQRLAKDKSTNLKIFLPYADKLLSSILDSYNVTYLLCYLYNIIHGWPFIVLNRTFINWIQFCCKY